MRLRQDGFKFEYLILGLKIHPYSYIYIGGMTFLYHPHFQGKNGYTLTHVDTYRYSNIHIDGMIFLYHPYLQGGNGYTLTHVHTYPLIILNVN